MPPDETAAASPPRKFVGISLRSWVIGICLVALFNLIRLMIGNGWFDTTKVVEDENVSVETEENTNGAVVLYAQLTNCSEATITLTMTLSNMSASCALPLTVDAKGRSSFELVSLHPTDTNRASDYDYRYHWEIGRRGDVATNAFAYHLPYTDGVHTVMQADFGTYSHQKGSGDDHAIDFQMPTGTRVCAARDGTVVAFRQDSAVGAPREKYLYAANYVVVQHEDGTFAEYLHLKQNGVAVSLGQKVKMGETLGFSGSTGFSSEPHLHFAVFQTVDGQTRRTFPIWFETKPGKVESLKENKDY